MEPGVFYLKDVDAPDDGYYDPNIPNDNEYGAMIQESRPDVNDVKIYDGYVNAEIIVDRDGEPTRAQVVKRARTDSGTPIGRSHRNPLFHTCEYDCVFDDGKMERYTASIIAENLYLQVDSEG
jgi:hypothetical protein